MTLRNIKITNIKDMIKQNKQFSIDDFQFEFPENSNKLALIKFRASPKYYFYIEENIVNNGLLGLSTTFGNLKKETVLQTTECPGEYKNYQIKDHISIDECIEDIENWLYRLDTDLKNIHIDSSFDESIDDFISKIDERIENPEELFSADEKKHIIEKLNELQDRVKQLEKSQIISPEHLEQTNEIIQLSKNNLETYPKKAWIVMTYNKFKGINGIFKTAIEFKEHFAKILAWANNTF